jgi:hypothetical protein
MPATHSIKGSGMEASGGGFTAKLPSTTLGKWAMWLAVAFIIGFMINSALVGIIGTSTNAAVNDVSRTYMPYWGMVLFACGFAAGVVGLVAMLRDKERSLITLLTVIPMLFVIMFLIGEFAVPH